jgi:hypothetical protein
MDSFIMTVSFSVPANLADKALQIYGTGPKAVKAAVRYLQDIGIQGLRDAIKARNLVGGSTTRPASNKALSLPSGEHHDFLKSLAVDLGASNRVTQQELVLFALRGLLSQQAIQKTINHEIMTM